MSEHYTTIKKGNTTVGICHDGELSKQDKKAVNKFIKEAKQRTIKDFHCSEHGEVEPEPACPTCLVALTNKDL